MKFKRGILAQLTMLFATSQLYAAPGNYEGGVKIGRMWIDASGVFIGFDRKPADCAGNWNSVYAKLSMSTSGFSQIYSLLLAAKASGAMIDFWYATPASQLSCSDPNFLLPMTGAGYNH